jgi:NitT/TauT family transport system permease protein
MNTVNRMKDGLLRISGLVLILLCWEFVPKLGWVEEWYIPGFSTVLQEIFRLLNAGSLGTHLMVTLWRAMIGLLLAAALALPTGFILGRWAKTWLQLLKPLMRLFSQANPFSLLPLFILGFGIGEKAKLAIVAWVCFWPILFNTVQGVQNVDFHWIKAARSMAVSAPGLMIKVLLPGTVPFIFLGLRAGIQMAFLGLIAAEMLGATAGLGWLLYQSFQLGLISRMFAASLSIVLLGIGLNRLLSFLENRLCFWKKEEKPANTLQKPGLYRITAEYALAVMLLAIISIGIIGGLQVYKVNSAEFERDGSERFLYSE